MAELLHHRRRVYACRLGIIAVAVVGLVSPAVAQTSTATVADLSLDQLANVEVTTSARVPVRNMRSPAATYVITQDDIRRSGVTSIPEALRLAPGVQVARIDSNKWAIGVRGFGSRLSRSILVMLDGRTVYTPLFAGTYWEVQDTLLEDIERIEVILGPGGTLWGANAVNGVINIITKSAEDTTGLLVTAGSGSYEAGFVGARYGGRAGDNGYYRAYGKFFERDPLFTASAPGFDRWQMGQGGFRADWTASANREITLQADVYNGSAGQRTTLTSYVPPFVESLQQDARLSGGNVLARLTRPIGRSSDVTVQTYYDRTHRHEPTFRETRDTFDVDIQQHFFAIERNDLVWGVGYRASAGDFHGHPTIRFVPGRRVDQVASGFLQDRITVVTDRLQAVVGAKVEHNGYSGVEAQPRARLLWTPSARQTAFAAATRAVRTPSRLEHDLELTSLTQPTGPTFVRVLPNRSFRAEELRAYEVGYRTMPTASVLLSVSTFVNQHRRLVSVEPLVPFQEDLGGVAATIVPFVLGNGIDGTSRGVELAADAALKRWWRIRGGYSHLHLDLEPGPDSRDISTATSLEASSPRHQFALLSSVNLPGGIELDWMPRVVSELPRPGPGRIRSYHTSDVRLAWTLTPTIRVAAVGQNLHEARHAEFAGSAGLISHLPRSVYGTVTWLR